MPCASSNSGYLYAFNLYASGSSISYTGILSANTADISATTAMFSNSVKIQNGTINADKIFIQDDATINLGKLKLKGDVYLVQKQDFDAIWWTWTNAAMNKYLEEHSLKPVHYENETYDSHLKELVAIHDEHMSVAH